MGTSLAGDPGVTPREERPPVNGVETAGELLGSPPRASICNVSEQSTQGYVFLAIRSDDQHSV